VALFTLLNCWFGFGKDSCFDCHRTIEGTSLKFTNDIHFAKAISCSNCHGGDPNETSQNIAMNASRGFKRRVQRPGVPAFCGSCHSDAAYMSKFETLPRVDQLAKYQAGVHGKLLAAGRKRAAECVDCHGVHNTRAVSDPLSLANPQHVSQTCGKCHASTLELFAGTEHGRLFTTKRLAGCTVCHFPHDTAPATSAMLIGSTSVCTPCHQPGTSAAKSAQDIAKFLADLEAAGPDSKDALARARIAVHSLSLEAVRKAAETVPPETSDK
jgi:hypothetical protein